VREGGKYAKESCVLQGIKRMEKGSRNLRKPESEIISLYATLQEPEFAQVFPTELISSIPLAS
jgi:hypothetical protein